MLFSPIILKYIQIIMQKYCKKCITFKKNSHKTGKVAPSPVLMETEARSDPYSSLHLKRSRQRTLRVTLYAHCSIIALFAVLRRFLCVFSLRVVSCKGKTQRAPKTA